MTIGTYPVADKHLRQRKHLLRRLYAQSRRVEKENVQAHDSNSKYDGNDSFENGLTETTSSKDEHETGQRKEVDTSSECIKSDSQLTSTSIGKRRRSRRIRALQEKTGEEKSPGLSNKMSYLSDDTLICVYSQLYASIVNQWHPSARCSSSTFDFTLKRQKTWSKESPFRATSFITYKSKRKRSYNAFYVGISDISAHYLESLDMKKSEKIVNKPPGGAYETYEQQEASGKEDIRGIVCQEEVLLGRYLHLGQLRVSL